MPLCHEFFPTNPFSGCSPVLASGHQPHPLHLVSQKSSVSYAEKSAPKKLELTAAGERSYMCVDVQYMAVTTCVCVSVQPIHRKSRDGVQKGLTHNCRYSIVGTHPKREKKGHAAVCHVTSPSNVRPLEPPPHMSLPPNEKKPLDFDLNLKGCRIEGGVSPSTAFQKKGGRSAAAGDWK